MEGTRLIAFLMAIFVGGAALAEETPPNYAELFKLNVQFPSCLNNFDGMFESTTDGCFQMGAALIWRTPSTGVLSFSLAKDFCANIDRLAVRRGQAPGWRLPTATELLKMYSDLQFVANNTGLDLKSNATTGLGILPFDLGEKIWASDIYEYTGTVLGNGNPTQAKANFVTTYNLSLGGYDQIGPSFPSAGELEVTFKNYKKKTYKLDVSLSARALCVRSAESGELPDDGGTAFKEEEGTGSETHTPIRETESEVESIPAPRSAQTRGELGK